MYENERNLDYQEGLIYLENRGFEVLSVTTDGRKGLTKIFEKYYYQICQFHIQKGVLTLLTKSPRSEAGKELNQINKTFIKDKVTEQDLTHKIDTFTEKYKDFLAEKSEADPNKFKHQKILKVLKKYKNNMKYLFNYQTKPRRV